MATPIASHQISQSTPLLLGSASPRRREILRELNIPCVVRPVDIDETPLSDEAPPAYVSRIVAAKAEALQRLPALEPVAGHLVADTTVVLGGKILGKPSNTDEALAMLRMLAGKTHEVLSRYALSVQLRGAWHSYARTVRTSVTLRAARERDLAAYAKSGEGLDKAGAYAAQGLGTFLIERIDGSYANVVGLPTSELVLDLIALGLVDEFPRSHPNALPSQS